MFGPLYFSTACVDCLLRHYMHANILLLCPLRKRPLAYKDICSSCMVSLLSAYSGLQCPIRFDRVLNTVHEALIVTGTFKYIMGALVNRDSLLHGAMVAVTTQGFFVYRIYIFNGKNIVVPLIFVPLAIYQLVYVRMALYRCGWCTRAVELLVLGDPFFMGMATSTLATAAALDVSIAVFLTYLLLRKQSVTGYASTIQVLHRLTVFAVNAGTWTATFCHSCLSFCCISIRRKCYMWCLFFRFVRYTVTRSSPT
ncbi:hypothetical protein EV363DRAFT_1425534 [Boletus edulis]|nr:hypothetical protein EV363DRAFT_1425534 [Boletus edulis]